MTADIEGYLGELRARLADADPALVQDALYDAEEYLRSEVPDPADAEAFAAAVERYGSPEEVAEAYRETERTVARALRRPEPAGKDRSLLARFFGVVADPSAYGALFYMFLSLATGVIYFTVAVTGLSMSVGLAILIVGIPFMLLFLAVVRAISLAEGRMVEGLLGIRMPRRPRVLAAAPGTILERVKSWITDARTWTTVLYMVLMLPLGIFYFTLFTSLLATASGLIAAPIVQIFSPDVQLFVNGDAYYRIAPWFMPVMMAAGALLFVVTLHLSKAIGHAHAAFAKVMLVGRPMEGAQTTTTAGQAV